ncbi:MAG: hypothetical protein V4450_04370 [Bacteroidota bacterium]
MARKRWTPQEEITDSLLRIREKRKWQLAYRRYVLERLPSESYAHYFGLDSNTLRNWFECQFSDGLNWENFGKAWQFDHIVPATYFDYSLDKDLYLCWSFINIRVEPLDHNKHSGTRIDVLAVRAYFEDLYQKTTFPLCQQMLEKIKHIEESNRQSHPAIENFISQHKEQLETIGSLSKEELANLNTGTPLPDILLEREILRKFSAGQKP